MVTLIINLVVAAWLFVAAFVLPYSAATAWNAMVVAFLVAAIALLAFSAVGRPGIRWLLSALAVWLLAGTMILPHLSLASVFNDVAVAVVLGLVSFVAPARWQARVTSAAA